MAVSHILGHLKSSAFRVLSQVLFKYWGGNICLEPNCLQAIRCCISNFVYSPISFFAVGTHCPNSLKISRSPCRSVRYWANVADTWFTVFNTSLSIYISVWEAIWRSVSLHCFLVGCMQQLDKIWSRNIHKVSSTSGSDVITSRELIFKDRDFIVLPVVLFQGYPCLHLLLLYCKWP